MECKACGAWFSAGAHYDLCPTCDRALKHLRLGIPYSKLCGLMEIYRSVPHRCEFCIGCEIEPADGHGCDKRDNFAMSVPRVIQKIKEG